MDKRLKENENNDNPKVNDENHCNDDDPQPNTNAQYQTANDASTKPQDDDDDNDDDDNDGTEIDNEDQHDDEGNGDDDDDNDGKEIDDEDQHDDDEQDPERRPHRTPTARRSSRPRKPRPLSPVREESEIPSRPLRRPPKRKRRPTRQLDNDTILIEPTSGYAACLAELNRTDPAVSAYFAANDEPMITTIRPDGKHRPKDNLPYGDIMSDMEDSNSAYFTTIESNDEYDSEHELITEMETALGDVSVPVRPNRQQRRAAERERKRLERNAIRDDNMDLMSVVAFSYMLAALGATATQAADRSRSPTADPNSRLKVDQVQLPTNSRAAKTSPQHAEWKEAEEYEINKHRQHGVFTEIKLGDARKKYGYRRVQESEFVYKAKPDAFGYIYRWRARLVCKAYNMRAGFEYFEKFASVPKHYTWKLLLALATALGLEIKLLDVESAFLNSELTSDEYVFVRLPGDPVYHKDTPAGERRKGSDWEIIQVATKALNGSPASPRAWKKKLNHTLNTNAKFKFSQSRVDPCLWIGNTREGRDATAAFSILMVVWVDDLLVISWCPVFMTQFIETIKAAFPITESDLDLYLSMSITHDKENRIIDCQQNELIKSTATALGLDHHSRSRETPQEPKIKMTKANCPTTAEEKEDQKQFISLYRTGVGVALWISGMTRNDSKHAVAQLSRFVSNPGRIHWNALLGLYRYWLHTPEVTLRFSKAANADLVTNKGAVPEFELRAASDASWGSEDDASFYCGWALIFCGCILLAKSKKWPSAAISSCEAELIALSECARDVRPTRWMLEDVGSGNENQPSCGATVRQL